METKIIYPDGDVVLCNGTGDSAERFLVSTIFLKNASKVFTAMFSDRFAEGQKLSSAKPPDVVLEQDKVLGVLLGILHLYHDDMPSNMTINDLRALAVLADKYGCVNAIMPACSGWSMAHRSQMPDSGDKIILVEVAFLLNDARNFRYWTMRLAKQEEKQITASPDCRVSGGCLREWISGMPLLAFANAHSFHRAPAGLSAKNARY